MPTKQPPKQIEDFLLRNGFKMNGYDFWKKFAVTNLETDWEEEVYVSFTGKQYEIVYPDRPKSNKTYKTQTGLMTFITLNHS